jgi:hypothetical protein
MVKGYRQYLKENCGCGENLPVTLDPVDFFSKVATTIAKKPDTCPSCSKFPESCECRGNCGNCRETNGQCDCSLNQDIKVGDIVRNVNAGCPHFKSIGRVIDIPSNNSVTYSVIKPSGSCSVGQLLNKTRDLLTVDEKYRL